MSVFYELVYIHWGTQLLIDQFRVTELIDPNTFPKRMLESKSELTAQGGFCISKFAFSLINITDRMLKGNYPSRNLFWLFSRVEKFRMIVDDRCMITCSLGSGKMYTITGKCFLEAIAFGLLNRIVDFEDFRRSSSALVRQTAPLSLEVVAHNATHSLAEITVEFP